MYNRPRSTDVNPYPFKVAGFVPVNDDVGPGKKSDQTDQSDSKTQKDGSSASGSEGQESTKEPKTTKSQQENDFDGKCPEWKCFIKSPSNSSLLITFVPASFDDVILLNKSHSATSHVSSKSEHDALKDETKAEDTNIAQVSPEEAPSSDADGRSDSDQSTDSDDAPVSNQCPVGENSSSNDEDSESPVEEAHHEPEEKVQTSMFEMVKPEHIAPKKLKLEIPKVAPAKKTVQFPVYVYDCLVQNVLDSLVFPWDFQLSSDVYQDKTFDFGCELEEPVMSTSPKLMKRVSFSVESLKVCSYKYTLTDKSRKQPRISRRNIPKCLLNR